MNLHSSRVMLVYYKFYYIGLINLYVIILKKKKNDMSSITRSNSILIFSFVEVSLIATSICNIFEVTFIVSPKQKLWINRNKTQSPLSKWKMLKLIQILRQKI